MSKKLSDTPEWLADQGAEWITSENVVPYIYMRKENLINSPGAYVKSNWFSRPPVLKNPLKMSDVNFADQILNLESKAFQKSAMPMPRWVFYDCSVMPGIVCGFAQRTETLSEEHKNQIGFDKNLEWTPLSLFIIIPTVRRGEWVAHNLCTVNSLLSKEQQKYALGFLTKAFGLWYGNVEILCGMTQWGSPSIKLHSHYGPFEVLTAYTPVHSYAQTLTYRTVLDYRCWPGFFTNSDSEIEPSYRKSGLVVDPNNLDTLKALQQNIEEGRGPFFLDPKEIRNKDINSTIQIYCRTD